MNKKREKLRVQVDLNAVEAKLLELLQDRLSVRSRADLLQQAYGSFLWLLDEMLAGRHVVSVESEELTRLHKYKELAIPAVEPILFDHFQFLAPHPEKGKKQLYLKGKNMSVSQLIYKMRANDLSTEDAAEDMDLPVQQVREAQVYYQTHQELVDAEAAEEEKKLAGHGDGALKKPENLSR